MNIILHIEDDKNDQGKFQKWFVDVFPDAKKVSDHQSYILGENIDSFASKDFGAALLQTDNTHDADRLRKKYKNKIVHFIVDLNLPKNKQDAIDNITEESAGWRNFIAPLLETDLKNTPYHICTLNEKEQIAEIEAYKPKFNRVIKDEEDVYKKEIYKIFSDYKCTYDTTIIRKRYKRVGDYFFQHNDYNRYLDITAIGGKIMETDDFSDNLIKLLHDLLITYEGFLQEFNAEKDALTTLKKVFKTKPINFTNNNRKRDCFYKLVSTNGHWDDISFYTKVPVKAGPYKGEPEIMDTQYNYVFSTWNYLNKCKHSTANDDIIEIMKTHTCKFTATLVFDCVMFTIERIRLSRIQKVSI